MYQPFFSNKKSLFFLRALHCFSHATDGFSIVPDASHDGVKDFVELVVPILQERGLFHTEYEGETLRENLGVSYEYGLNHLKSIKSKC